MIFKFLRDKREQLINENGQSSENSENQGDCSIIDKSVDRMRV